MPTSAQRKPTLETEASTKRQQILKAAARTFLAQGYRGTSMEIVAKESGAGRQTVYNQFASKKALFDATLTLLWEKMPIDHIVSRTAPERTPEEALLEIGNAIAEFWVPEETVAFLRMVIAESIHFPELAESFFTFGRGSARRSVIEYFGVLRDTKALELSDPELAAAQFIGLINEPLLSSRIIGAGKSPSKDRRKQVVHEAIQTFLARYRAVRDI
ncbi:MAG: TetR/AcrR family transcriptional regulator [Edaphobacter sp.]|uniref:TetR/AcrR family transcriptional regulator n=1 Tax=Edaphobacter sp. TaxID=1934404 RepID=UPI00238A3C50|nr:TetR/AcrR family transcriptional regulator [Edaphobacter sp.]MDE1177001.1 TetR/AcrR family transcriptional regulator [Edaphobacter sp.]